MLISVDVVVAPDAIGGYRATRDDAKRVSIRILLRKIPVVRIDALALALQLGDEYIVVVGDEVGKLLPRNILHGWFESTLHKGVDPGR